MNEQAAAEHLQVIRTLMERSAVYRRALAPITLFIGILGLVAAAGAWLFAIQSASGFITYWLAVNLIGWPGAFLLARRQAIKDREPFWSPPARRVVQAMLPSLLAGLMAASVFRLVAVQDTQLVWWLLPIWMVLYGLALYGAGFFMPRGIRLFGWLFLLSGLAVSVILAIKSTSDALPPLVLAHCLMGVSFGGGHLAYGAYLYLTEKRKNVA
ncbi:MAG: hypothetical protein IH623_05170 [Verrucomicrobia bacterium]|nr:hypothetical protein [Verrucomicrobiota bacterium]